MDNFMGGLEKFGLGGLDMSNLFDDKAKEPETKKAPEPKEEVKLDDLFEEDYLFDKTVECVVCDKKFPVRSVKASKVRRIGADPDLRPRYKGIDTLKYDITSCPYCGYTAMGKYFGGLSPVQIKLVKEGVCSKFQPTTIRMPGIVSYDMAIDRYKLAIFCSVAKKAKISERAYTCLKLSWLYRGKAEELMQKGFPPNSEEMKECKKEELNFYAQAYEGLMKAVASESFPICGMDSNTMDFLLAEMAFKLKKYDVASKLVGRLLTSSANKNVKDKALDLKQAIIEELRAGL